MSLWHGSRGTGRWISTLTFGALVGLVGSCGSSLDAGQWGRLRFMGRVKGKPPLAVLPPVSDRSGNIYTLYGALGLPEVSAFVTRVAGGSIQACTLTKGDTYGAHGWAGFAEDRAWYWSGDGLVVVPAWSECEPILKEDPHTNVELKFRAVIPWVEVTPTRSSLVALIQSPSDRVPFSALIDLDRRITTNVAELPLSADTISILGVGSDNDNAAGVVLVATTKGETTAMQALFFDTSASLIATAPVRGAPPPEYGVVGALQFSARGTAIGLTSLGSLVVLDRSGGAIVDVDPSIEPIGVHRWNDALWLVGTAQGRPVVAPLDDSGRAGPIVAWDASNQANVDLQGALDVMDDRSFPARRATWTSVRTAIGPAPFLSAHSPWRHAPGTTLWVVAGPEIEADGKSTTSIAVAPVGLSYP